MNRDQVIAFITTNGECWKGSGAKEYLSKLSEPELTLIQNSVQANVKNAVIANAALEGFADGNKTFKFDEEANAFTVNCMDGDMDEPKKGKKAKGKKAQIAANEDPDDDNDDEEETPTVRNQQLSFEEWMNAAPVEVQEVVSNARDITNEAKQGIVTKLVANLSDPKQKKAKGDWLMSKPLNELKDMLSLLPAPAPVRQQGYVLPPTVNYAGDPATTAPVVNDEDDAPLVPPTFNYAEMAKRK